MITGLHGPDVVPFSGKGSGSIGFHTRIDDHRLAVFIDDEISHIIVIMAFVVVPALGSHVQSLRTACPGPCCHALKIRQPYITQKGRPGSLTFESFHIEKRGQKPSDAGGQVYAFVALKVRREFREGFKHLILYVLPEAEG